MTIELARAAPPGADNETSGPPKADKSVSFDDGQPPAKKPKKLPPLVVAEPSPPRGPGDRVADAVRT